MESIFAVGLALGTTAESSGLAVVEGVGTSERNPGPPLELHVRYLHSFQPGTGYTHMIERISEMRKNVKASYLVVDQTAVGAPIVRMFAEKLSMNICPVIVGTQHSEHYSDGADYVPKQTLVGELIVGLEMRRLKISKDLPLVEALTQELLNYRNRTTSAASLNGDTWREYPADDLIFATGLACWKLQRLGYFIYDRI